MEPCKKFSVCNLFSWLQIINFCIGKKTKTKHQRTPPLQYVSAGWDGIFIYIMMDIYS